MALGATARKAADLATAEEMTAAFRMVAPRDPVKYDFSLTRLGIHPDGDLSAFLAKCTENGECVITMMEHLHITQRAF